MPKEVCDQWVSGRGKEKGDKLANGDGDREIEGRREGKTRGR